MEEHLWAGDISKYPGAEWMESLDLENQTSDEILSVQKITSEKPRASILLP